MKHVSQQGVPGITLRSVTAILAGLIIMGVGLTFFELIVDSGRHLSGYVLNVPAMAMFLVVMVLMALGASLFRYPILTRAELVCVLFALLFAVPIMSRGFATTIVPVMSGLPVSENFDHLSALSESMWPHGPNVLDGAFDEEHRDSTIAHGGVTWGLLEYEEGEAGPACTLHNEAGDETSWLRLRVPLVDDSGDVRVTIGQHYMAYVLARGHDLGPETVLYGRLFLDDNEVFETELFVAAPEDTPNMYFKTGFQQYGSYDVILPEKAQDSILIEFRLVGDGTVDLADPRLVDIAALENFFSGARQVGPEEYAGLRKVERGAYAVRPDNWFSFAGLKYILYGVIPLDQWARPLATWISFFILLFTGTFAVGLIMRRQWVENERYTLPIAQIPMALLGIGEPEVDKGALPSIWRNKLMWAGFSVGLIWCLLQMWHGFNHDVPNTTISFSLRPYFDDPGWGEMWTPLRFSIFAIFLSIALLMELNVLMSLVLGLFLYRGLYWLGQANGWAIDELYPYAGQDQVPGEQQIASYLVYGLLVLFFVRKHLWNVLRAAVKGQDLDTDGTGDSEPELFSYRTAVAMLGLAVVGSVAWGHWVDIPPSNMLVIFGMLLMVGFVATKLRAECGTPFALFAPGILAIIPFLGGTSFFAPKGIFFASLWTTWLIFLFLLPGLQFEFIEIARRARVRSRHLVYACLLGIVGGVLIGCWAVFTTMYGYGANTVNPGWWLGARQEEFVFATPIVDAGSAELSAPTVVEESEIENPEEGTSGIAPSTWAFIGSGAVTAIVTILRQIYPGFWFHPVGILLSSSVMLMDLENCQLWGSLLAAWAIRLTVLKLGGAATVRNKLRPFAIGLFLGAVVVHALAGFIAVYLVHFNPSNPRPYILF